MRDCITQSLLFYCERHHDHRLRLVGVSIRVASQRCKDTPYAYIAAMRRLFRRGFTLKRHHLGYGGMFMSILDSILQYRRPAYALNVTIVMLVAVVCSQWPTAHVCEGRRVMSKRDRVLSVYLYALPISTLTINQFTCSFISGKPTI